MRVCARGRAARSTDADAAARGMDIGLHPQPMVSTPQPAR